MIAALHFARLVLTLALIGAVARGSQSALVVVLVLVVLAQEAQAMTIRHAVRETREAIVRAMTRQAPTGGYVPPGTGAGK